MGNPQGYEPQQQKDSELRRSIIALLINQGLLDETLVPFANEVVTFIKDGTVPTNPIEADEYKTEAFEGDQNENETDAEWLDRVRRAALE